MFERPLPITDDPCPNGGFGSKAEFQFPIRNGTSASLFGGPPRSREPALAAPERWSPFFGQVVKLGLPDEKDGPDDGQAEAVWG